MRRGLEGLTEPTQGQDHEKSSLHDFTIKAFTWESKPDEARALEIIEEKVEEFIKEFLEPAEIIVAKFNSDVIMSQNECERLLLNLQSVVASVEEEISRRYIKAQLAYYMWDDDYWKAYREPVTGTTSDLTAYARVKTSDARYFYFVNYAVWKQIQDKLFSLKAAQKSIQQKVFKRSW